MLKVDYEAIAYGPIEDSILHIEGSDDCASPRQRAEAVGMFCAQTDEQGRWLEGRLAWECRLCDEPRERFPRSQAQQKPDRDWVFEEWLRDRRETAFDPANGCAGCPLSYIDIVDSDRSLVDAYRPWKPLSIPDQAVRRADVEAHRWKSVRERRGQERLRVPDPETRRAAAEANRRKRRGRGK